MIILTVALLLTGIVVLCQLAGTTLVRAGIRLHLFTSCETALLPFKAIYYELLVHLRHNRRNIELGLRGNYRTLNHVAARLNDSNMKIGCLGCSLH